MKTMHMVECSRHSRSGSRNTRSIEGTKLLDCRDKQLTKAHKHLCDNEVLLQTSPSNTLMVDCACELMSA